MKPSAPVVTVISLQTVPINHSSNSCIMFCKGTARLEGYYRYDVQILFLEAHKRHIAPNNIMHARDMSYIGDVFIYLIGIHVFRGMMLLVWWVITALCRVRMRERPAEAQDPIQLQQPPPIQPPQQVQACCSSSAITTGNSLFECPPGYSCSKHQDVSEHTYDPNHLVIN